MTTRIPAAEITGFYGALIKKFSAKMFGKVPESLGVMWHNQPVLKASMGFGQKLQKWNSCDESLKSYAHMAVASFIGCTWCLDYNYFMAHNHGLDLEKARHPHELTKRDDITLIVAKCTAAMASRSAAMATGAP